MVPLGDIPIDQITLAHPGLKFLVDFHPARDTATARLSAQDFLRGHDSDGYRYASTLQVTENSTFALRMIAYKIGNSLPPISDKSTMTELRFLSLALDKRADLIVAFRIIRKDANGSITIVWKELDKKEAPKIKFAKGEVLADFKP